MKLGQNLGKLLSCLTSNVTLPQVALHYAAGQTDDSEFGIISFSCEECRAEAIGIYLSLDRETLKIFNHTDAQEQDDVLYVNWFSMVLSGLRGLEAYNADAKKWGQAHSQARYVILRVLLQNAPELVKIQDITNAEDQKPDLLVTLNR